MPHAAMLSVSAPQIAVIAGVDCRCLVHAGSNSLDPDIVWAMLAALAQRGLNRQRHKFLSAFMTSVACSAVRRR
jgi:hypothetical protein